MSRQTFFLCIFVVLLQWQPWRIVSAGLTPPAGYSLTFSGKTASGIQKYECNGGSWTKTGSSADMYAPDGSKLGNYWSSYNKETRTYTYYWDIINTSGGLGESGSSTSGLQGASVQTMQVSANSIPEHMAVVKAHRGSGDAERVAFVVLSSASGGMPPSESLCSSQGASSGVPFSGIFKFYNQDQVPPKVPASMQPNGNFVENVFVNGKMHYKFINGKWAYTGVLATIYDVAGGSKLGMYGTVNEDKNGNSIPPRTVFKFNDPNGFNLQSQLCAKPVQMTQSGCAWQLFRVLSSSGYQTPFGKFNYVMFTSSMGGLPPKIAARTDGITYGSSFTALCHLYS